MFDRVGQAYGHLHGVLDTFLFLHHFCGIDTALLVYMKREKKSIPCN